MRTSVSEKPSVIEPDRPLAQSSYRLVGANDTRITNLLNVIVHQDLARQLIKNGCPIPNMIEQQLG